MKKAISLKREYSCNPARRVMNNGGGRRCPDNITALTLLLFVRAHVFQLSRSHVVLRPTLINIKVLFINVSVPTRIVAALTLMPGTNFCGNAFVGDLVNS